MLNKEEKEILFSYPLMETISTSDYMIDFVLKNPSNYPISSGIMKLTKWKGTTPLKSYYTRENIKNCIRTLYNLYNTNAGKFEHQHNFTSMLIYILLVTGPESCHFSIIEKNENDVWVAIIVDDLSKVFILNSDCTDGLYIISNDDYYYFKVALINKNVNDTLNTEIKNMFYRLPTNIIIFNSDATEMDKYVDRYELMMRFFSGESINDITVEEGYKNMYYFSNDRDRWKNVVYIIKHDYTYELRNFSLPANKEDSKIQHQQEIAKDADPLFDRCI